MKNGCIYSVIAATVAAAVVLVAVKQSDRSWERKSSLSNTEAVAGIHASQNSPPRMGVSAGVATRIAYRSPAPVKLPSGNLSISLPELEARAMAGSPKVAYALAMDLFACALHVQDDDDRFASDPSITFGDRCKGLTNANYDQALKLLTYAADNDDVNAQNAYMGEVGLWMRTHPELQYQQDFMSSYVTNSLSYLSRAASSGNVDAMMQLAQVYDAGVITSRDPSAAYAYVYAINKTGLLPSSQRMLAYWQSRFTPQEVSKGISAGDQIFRECCSK